jgi:hypothetical protein
VKPKEMILHIGLGKCGTSSLQSFFARNDERLSAQGIYYPEIEIDSFKKARSGEATAGNGGELACSLLQKKHFFFCEGKQEKLERLKRMIRSVEVKNLLVSSEMFSVLNKRQALNFIEEINAWGLKAHVICYIRRQDEMAVSSYVQGLIAGHSSTIQSFDKEVIKISKIFRYTKLLEPWINLPKGNRLTIEVFDKRKLKNEDVVSDFLSILDLDPKACGFIWPKKVNVSLNAVSSLLLYHLRKEALEEDLIQRLVKISKSLQWGTENHDALSLLNIGKRKEIMAKFGEDNAKIAKMVLRKSDGVLFDELNENLLDGIPNLIDAFPLIRHLLAEFQVEKSGGGIFKNAKSNLWLDWIRSR